MKPRMERVVGFLSSGLGCGGSEHNLLKLLGRLSETVRTGPVASLSTETALVEEIARRNTPVFAMGVSRVMQVLPALRRLLRVFRRHRIDLLQTWMPHADLIGGLIGRFFLGKPVIWNIRQTFAAEDRLNPPLTAIVHLCARLSRVLPAAIVCCSESARQACVELGYAPEKLTVIHNGYDTARFCWNVASRADRRAEWGCRERDFVIGVVGRHHPKKDYETLFQALTLVRAQSALAQGTPGKVWKSPVAAGMDWEAKGEMPQNGTEQPTLTEEPRRLKVVLVGTGLTGENPELMRRLQALGLVDTVVPVGPQKDIETVYSGFDLFVLPSSSEGFPNVLAEAMACECPVVSTRVGEAELIIGECGLLVPPRAPEALARAIQDAWGWLPERRREMGRKARERIERCFGVAKMRNAYAELYERILG